MISTLAQLHSIDPDSIGLQGFGKKTGFYTRHCNTFSRIEQQQSKIKDKDTGKELGRAHERFDEIVDFVRKNVPSDRAAIVHGDFKFDNVVCFFFFVILMTKRWKEGFRVADERLANRSYILLSPA